MPILDSNTLEFFSHSPQQTKRAGIRIGALIKPGDVLCLEGDLGSGKTTLVHGIAQGWGTADLVTSPTYVIVNEYLHPSGIKLFHLDAYRLQGDFDAEILDIDLLLQRGPLIIEWAERIKKILPPEYLWINMRWMGAEQRHLTFIPTGSRYERMTNKLRQLLFGAI